MQLSTARNLVRLHAILMWIAAALLLFGATMFLARPDEVVQRLMEQPDFAQAMAKLPGGAAEAATRLPQVAVFVLIPLAVFFIITGIGEWREKRWARVTGIIASVVFLFGHVVHWIIALFGLWLFTFSPAARMIFSAKAPAQKTKRAKKR